MGIEGYVILCAFPKVVTLTPTPATSAGQALSRIAGEGE